VASLKGAKVFQIANGRTTRVYSAAATPARLMLEIKPLGSPRCSKPGFSRQPRPNAEIAPFRSHRARPHGLAGDYLLVALFARLMVGTRGCLDWPASQRSREALAASVEVGTFKGDG
jgi:hypothetical protein